MLVLLGIYNIMLPLLGKMVQKVEMCSVQTQIVAMHK